MNATEFDKLLAARLDKTRATLASKAGEYATDNDRLHNFHTAAVCVRRGAADVCNGFALKHWVSIRDMLDKHIETITCMGRFTADHGLVDEKIGDAICYLVLLEALLKEPS